MKNEFRSLKKMKQKHIKNVYLKIGNKKQAIHNSFSNFVYLILF